MFSQLLRRDLSVRPLTSPAGGLTFEWDTALGTMARPTESFGPFFTARARATGLRYVYTGNVHDEGGGSTYCPSCGEAVIVRDWYRISRYRLSESGACLACGAQLAGRYQKFGKPFGPRRIPVRLAA